MRPPKSGYKRSTSRRAPVSCVEFKKAAKPWFADSARSFNLNMSNPACVLWNQDFPGSQSKFVQDNSWSLCHSFYSPLQTDLSVKAGSKRMVLSRTSGNSAAGADGDGLGTGGGKSKQTEDYVYRKHW